ncbi:CD48 antigen-like [Garra rufa]|uniref:CD48 antigen-like n=1 Tax=Garra rufa TaxID=137080 RepID=UPI003CCE9F0D
MLSSHIVECLLRISEKMIHSASFFCLCFLLSIGEFGDTDEVKSVSVTEGDSVTLNTDINEAQRDVLVLWMFGPKETLIAEIYKQNIDMFVSNVAFGVRLQMDGQTGSLTIRNIRTEHSGFYKLQIFNNRGTSFRRFSVTVYAPLPIPVITRDSSNCSSSSSEFLSVSKCSLLCSVVNVSHVSLSWYKGNSLLSNISVSDLSSCLFLPLEVEYQDKNTYSCVVAYSFTNQTMYSNISELCQPHPALDQSSRPMMLRAVILALLLVFIAVVAGWHHRRSSEGLSSSLLGYSESRLNLV